MTDYINLAITQRALHPRRQYPEHSPRTGHDYGRGYSLIDSFFERKDEKAATDRDRAMREVENERARSDLDDQDHALRSQDDNVPAHTRPVISAKASRSGGPPTRRQTSQDQLRNTGLDHQALRDPDDVFQDGDDEYFDEDDLVGQTASNHVDGGDGINERFQQDRQTTHDDDEFNSQGEEHTQKVSRGVQSSLALLLSPELLAKVEQAIVAHRSHLAYELWEEKQNEEIHRSEMYVLDEIRQKEYLLEELREGSDRANILPPDFRKQETFDLQTDINVLRKMTRTFQLREQIVDNKMKSHADVVRSTQRAVIAVIEEAFVGTHLSVPDTPSAPPVEKYDIGEDFERMYYMMYPYPQPAADGAGVEGEESGEDGEDRVDEVDGEDGEVAKDEEDWENEQSEQERRVHVSPEVLEGLIRVYYEARHELLRAQNWVDSKDERREQELYDHHAATSNGEETYDANEADLHVRWIDEDFKAEAWVSKSKEWLSTLEKNLRLVGADLAAAQRCASKEEFQSHLVDPVDEDDAGDWVEPESDAP